MPGFDDESTVRRPTQPKVPIPEDAKPFLVILSGPSIGRTYKFMERECVLGRSFEADFRLDDDGVSRKHAKLIKDTENLIELSDLQSKNGTFINGQRVTTSQMLSDGDHIELGKAVVLKFSYQAAVEEHFSEALYESATRDSLTHAFNRRFFDEQLEKDFSHSKRHSVPLSILIFDIDFFKRINDTYGHLVGDEVLQRLGEVLSAAVRTEDVPCRIGGEEFAVIMRDCNPEGAASLAERLRSTVERTHFAGDGQQLPVTISVGVATFDPAVHAHAAELIEHADRCVYEAKRQGRNQVSVNPIRERPTLLSSKDSA